MNQITLYDTDRDKNFSIEPANPLSIYICGPTVYTASHVGHLKTYMTFDIIRRVLRDYLNMNIVYMMNITNVDDKIIRSTYLKNYPELTEKELEKLDILDDEEFVKSHPVPETAFKDYADHWEHDFFSVMESVNIERPDILSRVTEYIDEILEFVEEIEKNGYAFEHDGSVYFYGTGYLVDSGKQLNDIDEADYHNNSIMKDPKSIYNFVLLKRVRMGEPGWDSRWGRVRPGWHIECSAMASSVFGHKIDIHGGGIDLAFPHHHNEVLQSNARFYGPKTSDSWVSHFMHTGHLNIKGLKMSRSLKNFITIEEILKEHSPDELRMLFLLHQWEATMDYSDDTMRDAVYFTQFFQNFNKQVKSILLRKSALSYKKYGDREIKFCKSITDTKKLVDMSLRINLRTPMVINGLQFLISETYKYVEESEAENDGNGFFCSQLVEMVYSFVRDIHNMFGLTIFSNNDNSKGKEKDLIRIVSEIRLGIRENAKNMMKVAKKTNVDPELRSEIRAIATSLYDMTDDIRDKKLKEIGVELTDK